MASMLADVINAGTAYRARQSGFTLPAAGKTGTTNDYVDAWFVGFTPKLVTGVWIGFDQPKTIIRNGYAGEIAVPLWASFMKVATRATSRSGSPPAERDRRQRLPHLGQAAERRLRARRGRQPRRLVETPVDDLHRVLRQGHAADRRRARCTRAPSFMDAIAGVFGKDVGTAPMPVGATGLPTAPPARRAATAPAPGGGAAGRDDRAKPAEAARRRSAASGRASSAAAGQDEEDRKKEEDDGARKGRRRRNAGKKSGGRCIGFPTRPCHSVTSPGIASPPRSDGARSRRGSLPPSLIFAGPDGVGKRLAAIALAQLFNCRESPAGDAAVAPDACGTAPPAAESRAACMPTC